MRREAPRKIQCRASQRQLLVNNNNLNAGPGPAWFLLAPSCSFVLAVAGFCRREERQGKQVNQSTPSRHQSRSNSGAERREKMDVHLGPDDVVEAKHDVSEAKHDVVPRPHDVVEATHDVVAAKHDVVAAKHDVVAAKHDVRAKQNTTLSQQRTTSSQHSTTSERSKARRRLTCLSLRELFSPPPPPPYF